MKPRWLVPVGVLLLGGGAAVVLFIERIHPVALCLAGFLAQLGMTVFLWSLGRRLDRLPRPHSLIRQDELKEYFRGYPR